MLENIGHFKNKKESLQALEKRNNGIRNSLIPIKETKRKKLSIQPIEDDKTTEYISMNIPSTKSFERKPSLYISYDEEIQTKYKGPNLLGNEISKGKLQQVEAETKALVEANEALYNSRSENIVVIEADFVKKSDIETKAKDNYIDTGMFNEDSSQ